MVKKRKQKKQSTDSAVNPIATQLGLNVGEPMPEPWIGGAVRVTPEIHEKLGLDGVTALMKHTAPGSNPETLTWLGMQVIFNAAFSVDGYPDPERDMDALLVTNIPNVFEIKSPSGSVLRVVRAGKVTKYENTLDGSTMDWSNWLVTFTGPPLKGLPDKRRGELKIREQGTKMHAIACLGKWAADLAEIKARIHFIVKAYQDGLMEGLTTDAHSNILGGISYAFDQADADVLDADYDKGWARMYDNCRQKHSQLMGMSSFIGGDIRKDDGAVYTSDRYEDLAIPGMGRDDALVSELNSTPEQIGMLVAIALHEISVQKSAQAFLSIQNKLEDEMAKDNGLHVWWEITGGQGSINKIIKTLTRNRHMVVLDGPGKIFLEIQHSENKFVNEVVKEYNLKARHIDAPEYGETLCGKQHTNPNVHSSRCNACARERSNRAAAIKSQEATEAKAAADQAELEAKLAEREAAVANKQAIQSEPATPTTHSPDRVYTSGVGSTHPRNPIIPPRTSRAAEDREIMAKHGPIITVQGPQAKESNDIQGLATEYRRVSDELLEQANYYATLAERYEALLQPTDAVKQAEAILEQAKAAEQAEREAQIQALQDMLRDGPPTLGDNGEKDS